jgi:MFS transporter, DHA2 family, multidrug resistance protein
VLPASSWFSLKFGRGNFLLFCIALFTAASFFCGAATSLGMILLARTIQGAGGGALQPLSQSILLESFPPAKRGSAMALFALGVVVAPVVGPTLGGWLTDQYTWRWAFYINIPIGVVATLLIMRFVKDPPYIQSAKPGKMDSIGLGLLALWIGTLQVILDKGQEDDWFGATWIRWAAAVLLIAFVSFLIRELVVKNPIVNLKIFKDRNFAIGCLLIAAFGAVLYGTVTLLPLFYQTLMNYTASAAGLAVSPRGIGAILIMPVIAVLTSKLDNRYLIAAGFAIFAGCAWWISEFTLQVSQWSLFWPITLEWSGDRADVRAGIDYGGGNVAQRTNGQCQRALQSLAKHWRQRRDFTRGYAGRTAPASAPDRIKPRFFAEPRIATNAAADTNLHVPTHRSEACKAPRLRLAPERA